eukprot:4071861-Ditylum_brightwellii.AAC.1
MPPGAVELPYLMSACIVWKVVGGGSTGSLLCREPWILVMAPISTGISPVLTMVRLSWAIASISLKERRLLLP